MGSISWIVGKAFDNYEKSVTKYEDLLQKSIDLNTSIKGNIEDVTKRLCTVSHDLDEAQSCIEKIPSQEYWAELNRDVKSIINKVKWMITVVTIVGGIGITTYAYVNKELDTKVEKAVKQVAESVITSRPQWMQPDGRLYIIDKDGNRINVMSEKLLPVDK